MHIAEIILSVLMAVAFLASGAQKLVGNKQSLQIRDHLKVDRRLWRAIGGLEMAGALGLLVGLVVPFLGIAAAAGLGMLMAGAIITHGRARDLRHAGPAVVMLIATAALAILYVA